MSAFGASSLVPASRDTVHIFVDPALAGGLILPSGLLAAETPDAGDIAVLSATADRGLRRHVLLDPLKPVVVVGDADAFDELACADLSPDNLASALNTAIAIARRYAELRAMVRPEFLVQAASALLAFAWTRSNRISPMFSPKLRRGFAYHAARVLGAETATKPPDPVTLLAELTRAGYLASELVDIAHPCPACGSINVLLRDGCPQCGGIDLIDEPLVHHFACAFQAEERRFLGPHGVYTCPKCRKELRHFGLDYDKPGQVHICSECGHRAQEARALGRCLACNHRFPAEDSPRLRILDYVLTPEGAHALFSGMAQTDPIGSILGERLPLLSLPLFSILAHKMHAIEQRHKLHTLALVIDLTGVRNLPQGAGREIQFFVRFGSELASLVRSTDVVAYHLGKLILLLPGADIERGRQVEERLRGALADLFDREVIDDAGFRFQSISDCVQSGLIGLR